MKKICILILLFFNLTFNSQGLFAASSKNIHYAVLANGMRVVIIKKDFQNIISHSVFYDVGGLNDFFGKAGLAHFLEHLMFRSTINQKSGNLINFFDRNGVRYNAGTSFEFTFYYEVARRELLADLMRFESDRMMNLILKDDEITKERAIVKEERRMRVDDVPEEKFLEQMLEVYYNNNYYGHSLIGPINDLNATQNQDFRDFYKKYYNPKNAVLVIVGDVDFDSTMKLVNQYYGILKNRDFDVKNYYRAIDFTKSFLQDGFELRKKSKNKNSNYYYLTVAPTFYSSIKKGVLADFLSYFFVYGNNMLRKKLVEDLKIASDISIQYDPFSKNGSPFIIKITLADNGKLNLLKDFMHDFFKNISHESIDSNEIQRLKKLFITNKIYQDDDIELVSIFYGRGLLSGLQISDLENYKKSLNNISKKDIKKIISKIFVQNTSMTGILLGGEG